MKGRIPLPLVLFCLLLFSTVSCSHNSPPKSPEEIEREKMEKNRVKKVTETFIPFLAGVMQPGRVTRVKEYDLHGLLVKETDFLPDGTPEFVLSYTYDDKKLLTGYTAVDAAGTFLYKVAKTYTTENKLKELYFHLPGGTYKYRTVASYDKMGRLSELAWYWTTGFRARNIYSYHGWNKVSDKEYDPMGKLNYEWTYRYDKENHLLQSTQVNAEGKISRRIMNVYKGSSLVKQSSYMEETLEKYTGFEYDENRLLMRMSDFNSGGKLAARYTYEYQRW